MIDLDLIREIDKAVLSLSSAKSLDQVLQVREFFFSKSSGSLSTALRSLSSMGYDEKRTFGPVLNAAKLRLEDALRYAETKVACLEYENLGLDQTSNIPVAARKIGSLHPIRMVEDKLSAYMKQVGYDRVFGPEIESAIYNFDRLNTKTNHPARDMHSTFYIEGSNDIVMRTHTSCVQVRTLEVHGAPIKCFSIGNVYRKDDDATHSPMFTQMEILSISKDSNISQLRSVIAGLLAYIFTPNSQWRMRRSYFPFTAPSFEVDVLLNNSWIEIMGCGMVHRNVLQDSGIDPSHHFGFAAGIGIERVAMISYGISDLRLMYGDSRWLNKKIGLKL